MGQDFDIAIIGAGIGGASLAAELAPHARVLVLEAEDHPGYHATGRSAAFWVESYGGPGVQPLTSASGPWLAANGFVGDRGSITIARAGQDEAVERFAAEFAQSGVRMERLGWEALEHAIPGLRSDWCHGILEPDCKDIDVAGLHAHYLAACRAAGVMVECRARLAQAEYSGRWDLRTERGGRFTCDTLVNAAGAWADSVAEMAGVGPVGIAPLRRTIAQLRVSPAPPDELPLVIDLDGGFYFKPEAGRLWLSPLDETPTPPCDAAPEELDVALAIARLEEVVDWKVEAVERKWAGLRSFAPDRHPVYGHDPRCPAFFWFAGQGGFGIQTSPAAARLGAQMLLGRPCDAMTGGIDRERYLAARFC